MKTNLVPALVTCGCCWLLSSAESSRACNSSATSITNLVTLPGDTVQVTGLSGVGDLTGYFYGSVMPHAFAYHSGLLTDLGTLGGDISEGFAINASGLIVGVSYTAGGAQLNAFLFNGTSLVNLGTLGGGYSLASQINDAGQVAGDSSLPNATDTTAFLYQNGAMLSLGTLGGSYSSPFALSPAGLVAGESYTTNGDTHAFLYASGTMADLGTLGGNFSSGFAVNDSGWVVGESSISNGDTHAFLYRGGTLTDLGTFGGTYSSALHINQAGQVVGIATTAGEAETHAFISDGTGLIDLGTLGGATTVPYALNNNGQVVGTSSLPDGTSRAFLWQGGKLADLNTLLPENSGWQLTQAQFINDRGRIVGSGIFNGVSQWFILDLGSTNHSPTAVAGSDQTVDCQAQVTLDGSSSSDPDSDVLSYQWTVGGTVLGSTPKLSVSLPLGTNLVTLVVTDSCGASSQATVTITVVDHAPPSGTCPAAVTLSADSNCSALVPDFTSQVVASDNCTPANELVISQNPPVGAKLGLGQHPVLITVSDSSGNSSTCTVLVTVSDTTPPVISSLPAPFSLSAGTDCQAVVPNILPQVVAVDSCTPANLLVKAQSPAAGTLVGLGDQSVQVTVTDAAGNSTKATVGFKVADATPPVIVSGPSALKISADSNCQGTIPNVTASVLATDNCTPVNQLAITQTPAAGTVLPAGSYTIIVKVADAAGNTSTFSVPVQIADSTAPTVVSGPSPVQLPADANCQAVVPDLRGGVLATDNCTPSNQLTLTQDPAAGTVLPRGVYSVVITVSDASGNVSSLTVPLSIVDATAPVIQALAVSPNVLSPPNHRLVPVTVSAVVSDNCDPAPVTKIVSITCNETTSPGDIQITGNLTAILAATKSNSGGTRVYTLNIEATDASANSSFSVVTVSVPKSSGGGSGKK